MSVVTFGLGSAPVTAGWGWWDTGEVERPWPPLAQIIDGPTDLQTPTDGPTELQASTIPGGPLQKHVDGPTELQKLTGGALLQKVIRNDEE